MVGAREGAPPSRALLLAAFAAVYGIWGSTFLAIAVAVESLPPLLMVSLRCLAAGGVLMAFCLLRGEVWPRRDAWRQAAFHAVFLFGAYGLVAWAEQRVASGVAAVLAATSAIFVLGMDGQARRRAGARFGMALGLAGVLLMVAPWRDGKALELSGTVALLGSSLLWAVGSVRSRTNPLPGSPLMATAMELLSGSALLFVAALVLGEPATLHPSAVSVRSVIAVGYLVVFGSIVAYSAFHWLLGVTSPSLVATHAYVNPVIALVLGWLLHGEAVGATTVAAVGMVLGGVAAVAAASS